MNELPKKLTLVRDQVIDHVRKKTPVPNDLSDLINWYESEGWEELVPVWAEEEHVALNFNSISMYFCDSELIANQEDDLPVTDNLRIKYARELISDNFANNDGYDCPSVQAVDLKNANGDSAVLGWLIEIHGQGGPVPVYQGAFSNKKYFYQHLKDTDYLLDSDEHNITDDEILRLWASQAKLKK